mmetsp:Transcript_18245/g.57403  ORF Transcript_18245/g.57403 Transcript_18245/m.57403 type:complete len:295 (-) Transcript_18245:216-1100(-)
MAPPVPAPARPRRHGQPRRLLPPLLLASLAARARCAGDRPEELEEAPPPISERQLRRLHELLDADHDGLVSLAEAIEFDHAFHGATMPQDPVALMERSDPSKDGRVTLEEHLSTLVEKPRRGGGTKEQKARLQQQRDLETAKFHAADADGDGELDESELHAAHFPATNDDVMAAVVEERVRQHDADGDGALTAHELWAPAGPAAKGRAPRLTEEQRDIFHKVDSDGDGVLSPEELTILESGTFQIRNMLKEILDYADQDGDKQASVDELESAWGRIVEAGLHHPLTDWARHHEL